MAAAAGMVVGLVEVQVQGYTASVGLAAEATEAGA